VLVNRTVLCGVDVIIMGCVIEKKEETLTYRGDKLRCIYKNL